jgi:hypothetical protein
MRRGQDRLSANPGGRSAAKILTLSVMLCTTSLLFGARSAQADGLLRAGELVVVANPQTRVAPLTVEFDTLLARIQLGSPADAEAIAVVEDSGGLKAPNSGFQIPFAIADRNTVFLLEILRTPTHSIDDPTEVHIWKIDVRSGEKVLIDSFPWQTAQPIYFDEPIPRDIAVTPDGHLLVLWSGAEGKIVRYDKDTFAQTEIISSTALRRAGRMDVGAQGDIYVQTCPLGPTPSRPEDDGPPQTIHITPGSPPSIEVIFVDTESSFDFGPVCSDLEVDHTTGDVVLISPVTIAVEVAFECCPDYIEFIRAFYGDFIDYPMPVSVDPVTGEVTVLVDRAPLTSESNIFTYYSRMALDVSGNLFAVENRKDKIYQIDPVTPMTIAYELRSSMNVAVVRPECTNGRDDDGDGLVDFVDSDGDGVADPRSDPHCADRFDDAEASACSDGRDNDLDTLVDLFDPDCGGDLDSDGETKACGDELDNDGDGDADRFDPHCLDAADDGEPPECSDGIDNNHNGLIDGADVLICFSPNQFCEDVPEYCPDDTPACSDGWDNDGDGYFDWPDEPHCSNPFTLSELPACDDGIDNDADGVTDLFDPDCDEYTGTGELPRCNDGADNNLDGLVDWPEDPGCADLVDDTELAACEDGIDNDGDGLADWVDADADGFADPGSDPDCTGQLDHAEGVTACSDGIDNDGDGWIDLEDVDCRHDADATEALRRCSDGIDNDGDGKVDYPADSQCDSPDDNAEGSGCGALGIGVLAPLLWSTFVRARADGRQQCSSRGSAQGRGNRLRC